MWGSEIQKLPRSLACVSKVSNSGASGNNSTKLFHVMCRKTGIKIWYKFYFGPAPLKFAGALVGAISDNFRLWSQISPERIKISTSGKRVINCNSFHIRRKNGEFWSTNKQVYAVNVYQPKVNISEDHFSLKGATPSNFYTCYRMNQGFLTHMMTGAGVPLTIFQQWKFAQIRYILWG